MSLSPQVRRERRAYAAKTREPKKFPRRRCQNCNGWFLKTRKNKKFCKPECKEEFRRYGSAFGPLKDYLTKLIREASKEEAARQFADYVNGKTFRRQLAAAGFIHRSMIRPSLTLEHITNLTHALDVLTARVKIIEKHILPPALSEQLTGLATMKAAAEAAGVTLGTNPEPQSKERPKVRRS